jgi:phospholipid/cholesterol/gamma-HCH transport system ATP-binding protein
MRSSAHPRVRQFLNRIPEPAVEGEMDYLQMLTENNRPGSKVAKKRGS